MPARRRLDIAARKERIQTIRKGEQHGPSSRRSSLLLASSFVLPVSAEMGQSLSRQFSTFMARGSESRTIQACRPDFASLNAVHGMDSSPAVTSITLPLAICSLDRFKTMTDASLLTW